MPSANTRHRASLRPVLFPAGLWFVWCCVALVAVFGSELPESNPNMTPSCPKITGKSIKRSRKGFSRNP